MASPVIRMVDGSALQAKGMTDFEDFGTALSFPGKIPDGEVWVDKDQKPEDLHAATLEGVRELQDKGKGMTKGQAVDDYMKLDASLRAKNQDRDLQAEPFDPSGKDSDIDPGVKPDVPAFLVNGEAARNLINKPGENPFELGGHDKKYSAIGDWAKSKGLPGAYWIDKDKPRPELKYTAKHEFTERPLMAKGMKYDPAHVIATKAEDTMRASDGQKVKP